MIFHLEDLEADFRTFYRLTPEDVMEMSGPHFLALAYRITAFQGVMAARVAAEQEGSGSERGSIESTPQNLQYNSELADVIDYG